MRNLPMLSGYRVLDFGQFVAGPTCGRLLAEMGAEVIKLELAPLGDRARLAGDRPRDAALKNSSRSTFYFQHNHSKKSLAVDVKQRRGRDLVHALVAKSDVVVENFAPGVMARAGLDYEALAQINPRLIMCSISLAGQSGPLSDRPGFDYVAAAYTGINAGVGESDRAPVQLTFTAGDYATGVTAAMAISAALLHRERTGEGQYIDCSLVDTYFNMHEMNVPRASLRGDKFKPQRSGSLHPDGGPAGIFRCGDGEFVALMVFPYQWPQLLKAMAMPELAEDPRFRDPRARRDNKDTMAKIIEDWLARLGSRDAAIRALEAERVPCAPLLSVHEAIAHPHLRERGTVRRVDDQAIGAFAVPGPPARFSRWAAATALSADALGEHNEEILRDVLGLSASEVDELYRDKTIVRDPLLGGVDRKPDDAAG